MKKSAVQVITFTSIIFVQVITCTKFEKDFVQVITCTTQPYNLQLVQDFVQVITCTKSQLVHDICPYIIYMKYFLSKYFLSYILFLDTLLPLVMVV